MIIIILYDSLLKICRLTLLVMVGSYYCFYLKVQFNFLVMPSYRFNIRPSLPLFSIVLQWVFLFCQTRIP